MAVTTPNIVICGCGPGSPELLTPLARGAVAQAEVLVGSPRLLKLFSESAAARVPVGADVEKALTQIEASRSKRVVVLVSGDPCLCSLAQPVLKRFGRETCEVIPGISSVQVAFARLGLDYLNARILSAHRALPDVNAELLADVDAVAILAGHAQAPAWIADLSERIGAPRQLFLCENLTLENERVRELTSAELRKADVSSLAIVVVVKKGLV
jgi:precorrin-6y C5,15-methyltransferase (decarboxylating) CbiE subunit